MCIEINDDDDIMINTHACNNDTSLQSPLNWFSFVMQILMTSECGSEHGRVIISI